MANREAIIAYTCSYILDRITSLFLPYLICRDRELAAVKINQADVEIIVAEIEVDQKQADRRLREHNGNVVEALMSYL